jgi:hypothetical protein
MVRKQSPVPWHPGSVPWAVRPHPSASTLSQSRGGSLARASDTFSSGYS